MTKPTLDQIAADLQTVNELGGEFGYGYKDGKLFVEVYADDGEIEATYPVVITVGEPLV